MATIVNNPPTQETSDNGSGFLLGTVLIIVFVVVMLYFGLPMIRNTVPQVTQPTQINNAPPAQQSEPQAQPDNQINVPDKIDVNLKNEEPAQ